MDQKFASIFELQQAYKYTLRTSNALQRIAKLKLLKTTIQNHESEIFDALHHDLRKSQFETAVTELYFIYGELDYALGNLHLWMNSKRVGKTLSNPFSSNRLLYEPKGTCLIISPWNYPFQLSMSPLISAVAAGNCVILKPSEISSATSKVIAKIIAIAFEPQEVTCITGNVEAATKLLRLPFDHIFFTGSTAVGKVVMEAAAKNLSSITLELGGKSPTIIDDTADLANAASKIAWGKLVNSGQTCIAPDYVFVHEIQLEEFINHYKDAVAKMFLTNSDKLDLRSYGKIINTKHYQRLKALVEDALEKGAKIPYGGDFDEKNNTIPPILLSHLPKGVQVMEEEIFGPILPIITYSTLTEVVDLINKKDKPLALYIFSNSKKNIDYLIKNTSAGGTCINDVLIHIANPKLPFGGANTSGMGSSHGEYGFKSFSHERAIVYQRSLNFTKLIYPPYHGKELIQKLLKKIM
jgi:aldehyde dehydrogenase (NAD+)